MKIRILSPNRSLWSVLARFDRPGDGRVAAVLNPERDAEAHGLGVDAQLDMLEHGQISLCLIRATALLWLPLQTLHGGGLAADADIGAHRIAAAAAGTGP